MKKLWLFLLPSLLWGLASWGQTTSNGSITAAGSSCTTAGACVLLYLNSNAGAATVDISGTFSGTLQFEGSVDCSTFRSVNATPLNSTTAATSTTGTGAWKINAASLQCIQVRGSSFASGTAAVKMSSGSGSASTGGGGGGSGTVTSASAGDLAPLFTTGVATATTTPALSFALTNAAANTVFGNNTAGSAAPGYQTSIAVSGSISAGTSFLSGTDPGNCGSSTASWCGTAADVATSSVAGKFSIRMALTGTKFLWNYGSGEGPLNGASGGTGSSFLTVAGLTAARNVTFPDADFTAARTDAANTFTGHQTIEGVTSTGATGTGKFVFDTSPTLVTPVLGAATATTLTLTGATAGFFDLPQGTTSAAVAPCNTATSICFQSPTSVTSQLRTFAGTPATGFDLWTNTAGSMVETLIGSSGSGSVALTTSPVFTTPNIGTATATSVIGAANTAVTYQAGLDAATVGSTGVVTVRGENVSAGGTNNLAGGAAIIAGGVSTGTATPAPVKIQSTALGLASANTAQPLITRYVTHVKAGSTTSATPTTLFNIASATNTAWGVEILVHVDLISSTPNVCGTTEHFSLTGTNNNSAFGTVNIVAGTISTLCSTGTLTLAISATAANPSVISVTPTWGTITTITSATITVQIYNVSQQEIALL